MMLDNERTYNRIARMATLVMFVLIIVVLVWTLVKLERERRSAVATERAMIEVEATNKALQQRMKDTEFLLSKDK